MHAEATLKRQVDKVEQSWRQKLWHLSNQPFACQADAQSALARELKGLPLWLDVQSEWVSQACHAGKRRPRKGTASSSMQWQVKAVVIVD